MSAQAVPSAGRSATEYQQTCREPASALDCYVTKKTMNFGYLRIWLRGPVIGHFRYLFELPF
jgi:hypothetical protein